MVQSDLGDEYQALLPYFKSVEIHHRVSCPHTHEKNSTLERKIRHIVDTSITILA